MDEDFSNRKTSQSSHRDRTLGSRANNTKHCIISACICAAIVGIVCLHGSGSQRASGASPQSIEGDDKLFKSHLTARCVRKDCVLAHPIQTEESIAFSCDPPRAAPVSPTSFKCRPRSTSPRDPSKSCRLSYSSLVPTIGKQPETLVNTNSSLYEVAHEKIPLHRKSLLSLIKYLIHTNTLSSFLLSHPLTK